MNQLLAKKMHTVLVNAIMTHEKKPNKFNLFDSDIIIQNYIAYA